MSGHPHWSQAKQSQQRNQQQGKAQQPAKQQTQPRQEKKAEDHGGFDSLLVGRKCKFKTGDGEVIEGFVSAASKFWYLVNVDGQVVIINKAYVVMVMPIQTPQNNNTNNNPVGEVSGNGRGQTPGTK
jgi:hypothetical protein